MSHLNHHLYEYKRGVRGLILHTTRWSDRAGVEQRLKRAEVAYYLVRVGEDKMNVFFGHQSCVDVVRKIGKERLGQYTPEEDFLLGTMLGYDMVKQCERYLSLKEKQKTSAGEAA
ncbi:MAG: DUF2023 family protein [Deltaproteobacteria bacterium]|nr:DUF2023 family protein [Deltaproteobacteria bacterium]